MSPLLKIALPTTIVLALSTITMAADHPHDKIITDKIPSKNETVIKFEEDLNAHFEKHSKALRDTDGMRLSFNGNPIGGFSMNKDTETFNIETMGSNTKIEKEVFIENGKKKTRIIIETDGDDVDFDIVPKSKKSRSKTEF